jgi:hypothetical protein
MNCPITTGDIQGEQLAALFPVNRYGPYIVD